jgi:hypothetical protein
MARPIPRLQHWVCNADLTVAVYFRQAQMLWWIADRLGLAVTSEQARSAFDALARQGVLRPRIKGIWELETSDSELLQWILRLNAVMPQQQGPSTSP